MTKISLAKSRRRTTEQSAPPPGQVVELPIRHVQLRHTLLPHLDKWPIATQRVFTAVVSCCFNRDDDYTVTATRIAQVIQKDLGRSSPPGKRGVQNSLQDLEEWGFIRRIGRRQNERGQHIRIAGYNYAEPAGFTYLSERPPWQKRQKAAEKSRTTAVSPSKPRAMSPPIEDRCDTPGDEAGVTPGVTHKTRSKFLDHTKGDEHEDLISIWTKRQHALGKGGPVTETTLRKALAKAASQFPNVDLSAIEGKLRIAATLDIPKWVDAPLLWAASRSDLMELRPPNSNKEFDCPETPYERVYAAWVQVMTMLNGWDENAAQSAKVRERFALWFQAAGGLEQAAERLGVALAQA